MKNTFLITPFDACKQVEEDIELKDEDLIERKDAIHMYIDYMVRHMHDPNLSFNDLFFARHWLMEQIIEWVTIDGEDETDTMHKWRTVWSKELDDVIMNSRVQFCLVN